MWKYCRGEAAVNDNGAIVDFAAANSITDLFKIKEKVTSEAGADDTKNVEIKVPLNYLSKVWITLEMSLINW